MFQSSATLTMMSQYSAIIKNCFTVVDDKQLCIANGDLCELGGIWEYCCCPIHLTSLLLICLVTAFEFFHGWWPLNSYTEKSERKEGLMVEVLNSVTMAYSLSTPTGNSGFGFSCLCLRGPWQHVHVSYFCLSCSSLLRLSEIERME